MPEGRVFTLTVISFLLMQKDLPADCFCWQVFFLIFEQALLIGVNDNIDCSENTYNGE